MEAKDALHPSYNIDVEKGIVHFSEPVFLEPVGIDADGTIKPLDELSFPGGEGGE